MAGFQLTVMDRASHIRAIARFRAQWATPMPARPAPEGPISSADNRVDPIDSLEAVITDEVTGIADRTCRNHRVIIESSFTKNLPALSTFHCPSIAFSLPFHCPSSALDCISPVFNQCISLPFTDFHRLSLNF